MFLNVGLDTNHSRFRLTIKSLISLAEKSLLLKVALLIRDGDFIGVLVFWSCT